MVDDVVFQKLLNVGFRLVSFRPRSRKEFVDVLHIACKKRHIDDTSIIETVLTRLTELGYVDDEKFAKWWIDQRNQFRPKGWRALSFELLQKGVDRHIVDALKGNDEDINAMALAKKAITKFTTLPQRDQKMKLYAYLARRGFEGSVISRVVDVLAKNQYNRDTKEA